MSFDPGPDGLQNQTLSLKTRSKGRNPNSPEIASGLLGLTPRVTRRSNNGQLPPLATFSTTGPRGFVPINQTADKVSNAGLSMGNVPQDDESYLLQSAVGLNLPSYAASNDEASPVPSELIGNVGTPGTSKQVFERRKRAPRKKPTQDELDARTRRRRVTKMANDQKQTQVLRGPHKILRDGSAVSFADYKLRKKLQIELPCVYMNDCMTGGFRRKCISHVFGRNKKSTRSIPIKFWITMCRKHYQREKYRVTEHYPREQSFLVMEQFRRIEQWGQVLYWTVKPRKAELNRLAEEDKVVFHQFDGPQKVGRGRRRKQPDQALGEPQAFTGTAEEDNLVDYLLAPSSGDDEVGSIRSVDEDESGINPLAGYNLTGMSEGDMSVLSDATNEEVSVMTDTADEDMSVMPDSAEQETSGVADAADEDEDEVMDDAEDKVMDDAEDKAMDDAGDIGETDGVANGNEALTEDEPLSEDDGDTEMEGTAKVRPRHQQHKKRVTTDANMLVGPWAFILDHVGDKSAAEVYEILKRIHATFDEWTGLDYPAIEILPHLPPGVLLEKVEFRQQESISEGRRQREVKAANDEESKPKDVEPKTTKTKAVEIKTAKSSNAKSTAGKTKATEPVPRSPCKTAREARSRYKAVKYRADTTDIDESDESDPEEDSEQLYEMPTLAQKPRHKSVKTSTKRPKDLEKDRSSSLPAAKEEPSTLEDDPFKVPDFIRFSKMDTNVHNY
ncbi:MAG: hypothetical protein M1814_001213 [Vezdaea aestivalis]|nr:MAG: hypothetical protein M1814_001213 [Vezdaea aestivalis]